VSGKALGRRDLGATFGTGLLLAAVGFATGTLAARLLGPAGRGQLAAIQIWPTFLAAIAAMGLPEALIYFSARTPDESKPYLTSALLLGLVSSVPFMVVGAILLPHLLHAQSKATILMATGYLLLIPLNIVAGLPAQMFRGCGRFKLWNSFRAVPPVGWLAILLAAMVSGVHRIEFLIYPYLLFLFGFAAVEMLVVFKAIPGSFRISTKPWPAMLKFGVPCLFTTVSQTLNLRMDQMLMAMFLEPKNLGLYVVAVAWSNAFNPAISALSAWFFPKVASLHNTTDRHLLFARGLRFGMLLSVCVAAALLIITPVAFSLIFGSSFKAATSCAMVLVVAAMISGMNTLAEEGLRGLGEPASAFKAELAGLTVTAISLALLLKPLGIMGAALASVTGYTATFAVALYRGARATGSSLSMLTSPRSDEIAMTARSLYASSLRLFDAG
jgi:O-antigen/teichoic acid export membrane protein